MKLRRYDLHQEGPELIFDLFQRVYGESTAIRQRWKWEWLQHPEAEKIHIFVADDNGQLVGMTVRMPVVLCGLEIDVPAWFATNSMIAQAHRGHGLIQQLYKMAGALGGIQLSKGTASPMFQQLLKMGYHQVNPDNFQACLLSPWRWLLQKFSINTTASCKLQQNNIPGCDDFHLVERFPESVSAVTLQGVLSPKKTIEWLNWRYVDIPHRRYQIVVRFVADKPVSWCVVRNQGAVSYLVDLRWEQVQVDEPLHTIKYAKKLAKASGGIKIIAWGTAANYRQKLHKAGFLVRAETPHFSFKEHGEDVLSGRDIHFVHGDGDLDYL